jgi:hypothetical protein
MSDLNSIFGEIETELQAAIAKFPTWPTDAIHAAAIVSEEAGELTKAATECTYEYPKSITSDVRKEALQTAAMAIRFLLSVDRYSYVASRQHRQHNATPVQTPERMWPLDYEQ